MDFNLAGASLSHRGPPSTPAASQTQPRSSLSEQTDFHTSSYHTSSPFKAPAKPAVPLYIPHSRNGAHSSPKPTRDTPTRTSTGTGTPLRNPDTSQVSGFTFSSLTAEIFEKAVKISEPIESSPQDDARLVEALCRNERQGLNYCSAFESLHGINHHSEYAWMRYYITHQKRFDKLVADQLMPPLSRLNVTQTPEASSSRLEHNLSNKGKNKPTQSSNRNFHKDQNKKPKDAAKQKYESEVQYQSGRKRGRSSSRERIDEVNIPPPPSRSPSPPVRIEKGSRGNKYTEEDKQFVVRYIQWKMQDKTESFTKSSICELMCQKAPHHSAGSWASLWGKLDLAEKIWQRSLASGSTTSLAESEVSTPVDFRINDWVSGEPHTSRAGDRRKPNVADGRRLGSHSNESSSDSEEKSTADTEAAIVAMLEDDPATDDDMANMGEGRGSYTNADMRMLARTIAKQGDVEELTYRDRIEVFDSICTQRSGKAWEEAYRRRKKVIDGLVRRYQRKYRGLPTESLPLPRQFAPAQGSTSTFAKRKSLNDRVDGSEDESSPSKRMKWINS